jgi:hypothetical protein
MPTRASKSDGPGESHLLAQSAAEDLIRENMGGSSPLKAPGLAHEREKNPAAVALSKLGAAKGGRARAEALSPRKRRMIAKRAAEARWKSQR